MVAGNCLRRLVLCALLFGAPAQEQQSRRDGGAEAMAAIGVRVPVIVREGKQRRRAWTGRLLEHHVVALQTERIARQIERDVVEAAELERGQRIELPLRQTLVEFDLGIRRVDFELVRFLVRIRDPQAADVQLELVGFTAIPQLFKLEQAVLPDRDDMRKHMDSLIHHFLIVAEGFNVPAGEVYLPIEGSKGELGCYMRSNGGPKPDRVHFRGPSFINLQALPVMSEGEMIADVVAIIGSLDIVLGEIDR